MRRDELMWYEMASFVSTFFRISLFLVYANFPGMAVARGGQQVEVKERWFPVVRISQHVLIDCC